MMTTAERLAIIRNLKRAVAMGHWSRVAEYASTLDLDDADRRAGR